MDLERFKAVQKELKELKNIEKQHKIMNGKLYIEVGRLKKENEVLKNDVDRLTEERNNFETLAKRND